MAEVREIPISSIHRAAYNPRKELKPGEPAYERLKKSLDFFGTVEPPVWNQRSGNLVGGHQRLTILEARGDTRVQVAVVDLSDRDEKALNLALNKQGGEWDFVGLADLLSELDSGDFDMEVAGFDTAALEQLATWTPGGAPPEEAATDPAQAADVKRLADRFMLPPFTVLNAREGWWQDRKRAWIAIGIESERGRGAMTGDSNAPGGSKMPGVSPTTGKIVRTDSHARVIEATPPTTQPSARSRRTNEAS